MRILISGAAGYIGSNLALEARSRGYDVAGLDVFTGYYNPDLKRANEKRLLDAGIRIANADLAEASLEEHLEGVDGVVHLAGQPGISEATPWADYNRNNVVATHRLIEASSEAGVSRFVNISSSSVYGIRAMDTEAAEPKPASWYGETKLAAELEVMGAYRLTEFPACSLRLFSVYGERERPEKLFPRLIRAIDRNVEFSLFKGSVDHQRSFTYVGDICRAILLVLDNWDRAVGEIFNVGSCRCYSTGEAIEIVEKIMGKQARIRTIPARPGDQKATHANVDKIRRHLGWQPETQLKDGLKRMVAWYETEVKGQIEWK
jgi:UDP-glucuronate 4-epimerase